MGIGFFPRIAGVRKQVDQWISRKQLDGLLGLCNCCMYRPFYFILPEECRMCIVREGIVSLLSIRRQARQQKSAECLLNQSA